MSVSDPKVETGVPTAVNAAALDSNFLIPPSVRAPSDRKRSQGRSPYRTITDGELTLVQISCDFVCACIALPVALVLLSALSSVPTNAPSQFATSIRIDSLFPLAVVIA